MRTLEDVLNEVMKIINTSNEVETRLQQLKAPCYRLVQLGKKWRNQKSIFYERKKI
ncbi:MAG: hypothetical protein IPJ37_14905 [Bacteroidales bacterium]|nr:hypothetical protein [Bacteroidales bacterium]